MLTSEQRQELRTIWHNMEVASAQKSWETQDRANQRLATFLMNTPISVGP